MKNPMSGCEFNDAVVSLGIADFVIYGNPKNEEEFNNMFKKVVGIDSTNSAILSSDPSEFGITWSQVAVKKLELEALEPMRLLRLERNRFISETDWRATVDYPGTDKQLWLNYRQALRDLPETAEPQLDEQGNLINVVWPEAPE